MKYKRDGAMLYIYWSPMLVKGYGVSNGIDGEYLVFPDTDEAECFADKVDEALGLNYNSLKLECFGGWDENAVNVGELCAKIDKARAIGLIK